LKFNVEYTFIKDFVYYLAVLMGELLNFKPETFDSTNRFHKTLINFLFPADVIITINNVFMLVVLRVKFLYFHGGTFLFLVG